MRIGREITLPSNALIVPRFLSSAHASIMGKETVQDMVNPQVIVIFTERNLGGKPV
jgi:hypothetical protein